MSISKLAGVAALMLILFSTLAIGQAREPRVLKEWSFNKDVEWNGWTVSNNISDVHFSTDGVIFKAGAGDPMILSPAFEVPGASNHQWVEIDLQCDRTGQGEFFFSNKTSGQYSGLKPGWVRHFQVTRPDHHTLKIWPFWSYLGEVKRIRFDPPAGVCCELHSIRIMQADVAGTEPKWFGESLADSWQEMYAVRKKNTDSGLQLTAIKPQATVIAAVEPFAAAERSLLCLDCVVPDEDLVTLYWATDAHPGLFGQPIRLLDGRRERKSVFDLRQFPTWEGTVTHLAIGFGTSGDEQMLLKAVAVDKNDPQKGFLRLEHLLFEKALNRVGESAKLRAVLKHVADPPVEPSNATFSVKAQGFTQQVKTPGWKQDEVHEITADFVPEQAGQYEIELRINEQCFREDLHVEPALVKSPQRPADGYDVPKPNPVESDYQIGVYYFPGWSPEEIDRRWSYQKKFPERDSLLGWYAEGRPAVADWHIKWAVENGISFFVYDWYWRNGKPELTEGLEEGFLNARYRKMLDFAVMWANHPPFADHTPEQMLAVTDYWIEHYFREPNYFCIEDKPYVSFFDSGRVINELGGADKARAVFEAMRKRVRKAGFPGLHIGACAGHDPAVSESYKQAGYDSITGYNYRRHGPSFLQTPYRQYILGHEKVWENYRVDSVLRYLPLLTVGWDSRPWHGLRAEQRFARNTDAFKAGLQRLKTFLDNTPGNVAILEAWNEWGEGSYIEPNREFGFGDIEAIRKVFAAPGDWPANIGPHDLGLAGCYDLRKMGENVQHKGVGH